MRLVFKQTETLSDREKVQLDEVIEHCIEAHHRNRQMITHLTLAGVTALTSSEARARELQRQGFFTRFWNDLMGKNQDRQARINFDLAQAQYASQQLLEQFAEQHLLSFELLSAVNNKLNTLCLEIDSELNRVYETLQPFFSKVRSELLSIHERLDSLERNVGLLKWSQSIEYHRYEEREYQELSDIEKIICVSNDFFRRSRGEWSTGDLMLLKSALSGLGLDLRGEIAPQEFFETLLQQSKLIQRFFLNSPVARLSELQLFDAPLLKGLEKIEQFRGNDSYVIESVSELLRQDGQNAHAETEILASLVKHYLLKNLAMQTERKVNVFDFVLELLLGLSMLAERSYAPDENSPKCTSQETETTRGSSSENSESDAQPALTELDRRMLGIWDFEWRWPYLNYCYGTLEITEKLGDASYRGRLCVDFGNSPNVGEARLYEKAIVRVKEARVQIRGSEPSLADWPPDTFALSLDPHDDLMAGVSEHANDVQGTIAFTKRHPHKPADRLL